MKIPTRMPSGGRILGICILGVAIRENPDTYAIWGLHFGYLHSGGCDVCLLGVAFWVFSFWVFAFWGLRFVKIPTRMGTCILGVAIRENPDTVYFRYLHSGGCDS